MPGDRKTVKHPAETNRMTALTSHISICGQVIAFLHGIGRTATDSHSRPGHAQTPTAGSTYPIRRRESVRERSAAAGPSHRYCHRRRGRVMDPRRSAALHPPGEKNRPATEQEQPGNPAQQDGRTVLTGVSEVRLVVVMAGLAAMAVAVARIAVAVARTARAVARTAEHVEPGPESTVRVLSPEQEAMLARFGVLGNGDSSLHRAGLIGREVAQNDDPGCKGCFYVLFRLEARSREVDLSSWLDSRGVDGQTRARGRIRLSKGGLRPQYWYSGQDSRGCCGREYGTPFG